MVDKELFDRYQSALTTVADLAESDVRKLLGKLGSMSEVQQAAYLLTKYPEVVQRYGRVAADVAREFYQAQRDLASPDSDYTAQAANPVKAEWAQEDVRDATTKQSGRTVNHLPNMAATRALGRADRTLSFNVYRDPEHPAWALVPHVGACAFCLMIGSRGFSYASMDSVPRHDGCRCTPVVDFDDTNPSLVGYDPGKLYHEAYQRDLDARLVTKDGQSQYSIGLKSTYYGGAGERVETDRNRK